MDSHCVMCGAYLADTSRMVCEKCEKPKTANEGLTLGRLGNAMLVEAEQTRGEFMRVEKNLWIELANVFLETDRILGDMERMLKGEEDG